MSDQAGLLQAIVENPEDDLPRLALADWLEETGDRRSLARAELIRTEIELDRQLAQQPDRHALEAAAREKLRQASGLFHLAGRVNPELERRDAELLALHGKVWAGECARSPFHYAFRRGFVSEIRTTPTNFLRHADRVFSEAPVLALRLDGGLRNDLTWQFWQCPLLRPLRYLSCSNVVLGAEGARELAECRVLGAVADLGLWATKIGRDGVEHLGRATGLENLTRLDLGVAWIGSDGARALAASPRFARLRWLRLWNNAIGNAGVEALAGSPHLTHLADLNLGGNSVTDPGWEALAFSPYLTGLRTLRLASNQISLRAARALADSPALAGLTRLVVGGSARPGVVSYVEAPGLDVLRARFGAALEEIHLTSESAAF